jgi:exonuclease SbcD
VRILHTSDWHVGRTLSRVSRLEESDAALREVAEIAERERVDAIVICGDIFEHLSPTAEAEQVVYQALERFHNLGIPMVLITGNHDSPARWQAVAPLLKRINATVVSDLFPAREGGMVEVKSRDSTETLQIACVPWISERRSYSAADLMDLSEKTYQSYADSMSQSIHKICEGFEAGKCHMLAAHIFITGSTGSDSERPLTIGEIYAVTANAIPTHVQYAALGHVHRPQKPPGVPAPARYSGSPLQLDFGEEAQEKGVVIVDMTPGKPAQVREVTLTAGRKLRHITGTLESLTTLDNDPENTYLKVTVICDGPQPGLSDDMRDLLPNALIVTLEYPTNTEATPIDMRSQTPRQLFGGYLSGRYQAEPSPELLNAFDELLAEVSGDNIMTDDQRSMLEPDTRTKGVAFSTPASAAPPALPENDSVPEPEPVAGS